MPRLPALARLARFPLVLCPVALGFLATPAPVAAADVETGGDPSVPRGRTVDDDVYLFGGAAEIDGTVTGDAVVAAGTLAVDGRIEGDVAAAVGTADVRGAVGGSVRVIGGRLRVFGSVGDDVVAAGGAVTIEPGVGAAGNWGPGGAKLKAWEVSGGKFGATSGA